MRYAKVDANQPLIVQLFRKHGFTVRHTHMVGQGFPDIAIGRNNVTTLIEIKDGNKPLTKQEGEFFNEWKGDARIVTCEEDVKKLSEELP